MLGANASGSGNKWLNFGATVASGFGFQYGLVVDSMD